MTVARWPGQPPIRRSATGRWGRRVAWALCLLLVVLGRVGFASAVSAPAPADDPRSGPLAGIVRDYRTLAHTASIADELVARMDRECERWSANRPMTIDDEEAVSHWAFSMQRLRRVWKRMAERWLAVARQPELSARAREMTLLVAFAAQLEWWRSCAYLAARPAKVPRLGARLNAPVPELGLESGTLQAMIKPLGDRRLADQIEHGYQQVINGLASDPGRMHGPVVNRMRQNHADIERWAPDPWRARLSAWWQRHRDQMTGKIYRIESAVYTWVGDTKYRKRQPAITHELVRTFKSRLRPGDILLERERWFLSNVFLPGFWPHAILYVGTVDDLRRLGLDRDPVVAPHLSAMAHPDAHGNERRVVEAISDGVVLSSLEEATDADLIAALRPRLTPEQLRDVIREAFRHVGKPYDFHFDFETADRLVCSELVYRAFRHRLHLNLKRVVGRWAMPTDHFVEKFAAERHHEDPELEFVFFLDSDPKTGVATFRDADAFVGTLKRSGFDPLLSIDDRSIE